MVVLVELFRDHRVVREREIQRGAGGVDPSMARGDHQIEEVGGVCAAGRPDYAEEDSDDHVHYEDAKPSRIFCDCCVIPDCASIIVDAWRHEILLDHGLVCLHSLGITVEMRCYRQAAIDRLCPLASRRAPTSKSMSFLFVDLPNNPCQEPRMYISSSTPICRII